MFGLNSLAGKGALVLGALVALFGLAWLARRWIRRGAFQEARADSAELRGDASRAGMEGYLAEKERLEGKPGAGGPPAGDRMRGRKPPRGQA